MSHPWSVSVIIPAAGIGTRMGASVPKQYLEINGVSVLRLTLQSISQMPSVCEVVVACSPEFANTVRESALGLFDIDTPLYIVDGGEQRQDSVRNALNHPLTGSLIAIHDAVRPFIDHDLFERVCHQAHLDGAAIPAIKARDTVKRSIDGLRTRETISRDHIWLAQTPQVFASDLIIQAHRHAFEKGFYGTDDASLVEYVGHDVSIVQGSVKNIKITEPDDLNYVYQVINSTNTVDMRIGYGYDVHRLQADRKLILGGVQIEHDKGLLGHSDADALSHAITDAIFGALALGDIGSHFPDTDQAYKNLDSRIFLREAVAMATELGYRIGNIDATVVAEKPKLRPYIDSIRALLAEDLNTEVERVSVKATTSEKMGFVGREEGMAAMATVLLIGAQ